MRPFLKEYSAVIGLLLLATIMIILLSTKEDIFISTSIVDTGLFYKTQNERWVYSSFNFYDKSSLNEFPLVVGDWKGRWYPSEEKEAIEFYQSDTVLLRKYYDGSRLVQFILIKSGNRSNAFHPVSCYSRAWNVTERGTEKITPVNWSGELYINRFSAQRGSRKEVSIYWFMWGSGLQRSVENAFGIMLLSPVYQNENESYALNALNEFASEMIPLMYKPREKPDIIGKQLINRFGVFGVIIEVLLIGLSFTLIFYNQLSKKFR